MLKIVRNILGLIAISLTVYMLITQGIIFPLTWYITLFLGGFMLLQGILEVQSGKKGFGYTDIILSVFLFAITVDGLVSN